MSSDENTPFLADNEHQEEDTLTLQKLPVDAHFKRPLKILTAITALLSFVTLGVAIAAYVILEKGDWNYAYHTIEVTRGLWIAMVINVAIFIPATFLQLPILLNIARDIAMSTVVLVFSIPVLSDSGPDCRRWDYDRPPGNIGEPYRPTPVTPTKQCTDWKLIVDILMPIAAIIGIVTAIIILTTLMLRLIALYRTKFWERWFKGSAASAWTGTGFTVQFSFSVKPNTVIPAVASGGREGPLVDTN